MSNSEKRPVRRTTGNPRETAIRPGAAPSSDAPKHTGDAGGQQAVGGETPVLETGARNGACRPNGPHAPRKTPRLSDMHPFMGRTIRSVWSQDDHDWLFSIVDVVEALTDSPKPESYWKVLKHRLKDEGNQTVACCNQLRMESPQDGKMHLTDVGSTEQILRLVQAIPSREAEPCKLWLAKIGKERLCDEGRETRRATAAPTAPPGKRRVP